MSGKPLSTIDCGPTNAIITADSIPDATCPKCDWYLTGNRAAISGGCERCGWIPNMKRKCVDCGTEESSEQIEFDKDCKCGGRFAVMGIKKWRGQ